MSLAQEKEDMKMLPRFKEVVCKNCDSLTRYCHDKNDHWFIVCPKFFNYKTYGRPVIKLSDFAYNAPIQKDLRIEDP